MKTIYIYEKPGPFGTLVQIVGFAFMFGGMFIGQWIEEQPLIGFLVGLAAFLLSMSLYTRFRRNVDRVRNYRLPQNGEA